MKQFLLISLIVSIYSCSAERKEFAPEKITEGRFDSLLIEVEKTVEEDFQDNRFVQHDSFPSRDSLIIYADIYERKDSKPTVLLCHQAGFSRGEYNETAFKIGSIGFSSMAIDQRSGQEANGVINKTAQLAKAKGLPTGYLDARKDIEAAIDYLYSINDNQSIILVGSSYSASLALLVGKENEKVRAIAAFSPGEYLKGINIQATIEDYKKPLFITSSKEEIKSTAKLVSDIEPAWVNQFKPDFEGIHGSKALWESTKGNNKYWEAFEAFLKEL